MLMPFGADFAVRNLGVGQEELWLLYLVTGIFSMIAGPLVGRLSDRIGKYPIFVMGSILSIVLVIYYCGLGITPFWYLVALNSFLFLGISARIISSSALMTAVPEPQDRGAFMSINSSTQQIAGGIAAIFAGLIVVQRADGKLENYLLLGYVVSICVLITIILMYPINKYVMKKQELQRKADTSVIK
jgi:predicted MFS family arabinose efflux permease